MRSGGWICSGHWVGSWKPTLREYPRKREQAMEIDPAKIDSKHLKISYLPRKEEISRRDLLFGLVQPHYEVVPAVDEVRCTGGRGCAVCLASCPQEAISLKDGAAHIDKDKCTACGACVPSCPQEAISSPLLDPEILDASLQSLLCQDGVELQTKVVLITSEAGALVTNEKGSLSPRLVEVRLPCMGALSPWLLLRSLDLGAAGIGVIPCTPFCRDRCQPRWQPIIRFVRALLVKLEIEPGRIEVFSSSEDGPQSSADFLQAFVEKVKEMGPARLRERRGSGKQLNLVALLKELRDRFNLDGTSLSGDEVPFGIVRINTDDKTCTLCGACPDRCPAGAVTLQKGPDSPQLLFDHSRCIACGACVKVCPEQVLRLEKKLDFSRLGVKTVLAEDRMVHCRNCGKEIAPLAMMRKIQDQLGRKKGNTSVGLAEFCPDCRIFGRPPSDAR